MKIRFALLFATIVLDAVLRGGRVFYTALGHEEAVWRDPRFQQLLRDEDSGLELTQGRPSP
jgi:type 1 glutamine amidotransferase